MAWSSIIGQQRVKDLLRTLHESGRLPHALLFYGPEGVGQDAVALELAKALNCAGGGFDACDTCPSCEHFRTLQHQRLKLVFPLPSKAGENTALDKMTEKELNEIKEQVSRKAENPYYTISIPKASGIKISSIRDIVKEGAFRSASGGRTVVTIFDADTMNRNAANALLKSLEEPSGELLFILTTSMRDLILPTIRSRCQQVRFDYLSEDHIERGLRKFTGLDSDAIRTVAHMANGSFGNALAIAENEILQTGDDLLNYMYAVVMNNPLKLMDILQDVTSKYDKGELKFFLGAVQSWFRDVVSVQQGLPENVHNTALLEPIQRFAERYPQTQSDSAIQEIDFAIVKIEKNVHLQATLLVLSQRLRRYIVKTG